MRRTAILCFVVGSRFALAQSVAFEAATIRPFPEGAPMRMSGCEGGPGSDEPGRINCEHVTVRMLLMRAYKVKTQEIFGPGWLDSEAFNIVAKAPAGANGSDVPAMFQALLAERFKVVLHHEDRPIAVYAVSIGKSKPKLKTAEPVKADEDPPAGAPLRRGEDGFPILRRSSYAGGALVLYRDGRARLQAAGITIAKLAESLSWQLDRPVVDETSLSGEYDVVLYWTPDRNAPGGRAHTDANADDADIFAAMEQQLGLRLVSKKVARDVLVIDKAERTPTEN